MANKKDPAKVRSRNYALLLYADNASHMRALEYIKTLYPAHVGIAHKLLDDDGQVILEGEGKLHYHVYLLFENPVWLTSICKKLELVTDLGEPDTQFIRPITGRLENALVYLIHLRNPEKEQYQLSDLFGSPVCIQQVCVAVEKDLRKQCDITDAIQGCLDWIVHQDDVIQVNVFARWVIHSPYFRAASSWLVREAIREHNEKIYASFRKSHIESISSSAALLAVNSGYEGVYEKRVLGMSLSDIDIDSFEGFDDD